MPQCHVAWGYCLVVCIFIRVGMNTNENNDSNNPPVPFKKQPVKENPEAGSGKQDREQSRIEQPQDLNPDQDKNISQESVTFEQDIENDRSNDAERDTRKQKPLGEDPDHVAEQGKDFEPGPDYDNSNPL
jgi:hypothetical protein